MLPASVSRNVKVRTPHQICSEPNGLWQRGPQYKQRTLSLWGCSRGLTGAIVKNVNCGFLESPSRRRTVPVTSSCACKPVWYKRERTVPEYLLLCGMYKSGILTLLPCSCYSSKLFRSLPTTFCGGVEQFFYFATELDSMLDQQRGTSYFSV